MPVTARITVRPVPLGVNAVAILRNSLREACLKFVCRQETETTHECEHISVELERSTGSLDPSQPGWDVIMSQGWVDSKGRPESQRYKILEEEDEKKESFRLFMRFP